MAETLFNSQTLAACITGFVTISGWTVTNYIIKRRENHTKLLQLKLEHISRQIEELYGPLFNILNQINMYYDVKEDILKKGNLGNENVNEISIFVREKFFYNLHGEMRLLIKEKYHLIDNNELPQSFRDYLNHSTQETLQIDIWEQLKINTSAVKGISYPDQFDIDAKRSLDNLKKEYSRLLEELN